MALVLVVIVLNWVKKVNVDVFLVENMMRIINQSVPNRRKNVLIQDLMVRVRNALFNFIFENILKSKYIFK